MEIIVLVIIIFLSFAAVFWLLNGAIKMVGMIIGTVIYVLMIRPMRILHRGWKERNDAV